MVEISVIMPAYNVESYVGECLDSIVAQTFTDMEIICVDDGSSDSTPEILKDYQKKDSRIKIVTKENGGLSSARNAGLNEARGKYIYFIDSDDYLEFDAMEKLYNVCEEKSLDCAMFKLINFYDESKEKFQTDYYDMEFLKEMVGDSVFSHRDIKGKMFSIPVSCPGKFFKRDIIGDLRFIEGIIFEDNPFFVEIMFKAERLLFLDEYLYNRRVRENSIITSNQNFTDYIDVSNILIDLTRQYGYYDEYKDQLYTKTIKNIYLRMLQTESDSQKDYFRRMKEDFSSKRPDYDGDEVFQNKDDRLKEIYYRCLEAETPKELELYMNLFDLHRKLDETVEVKNRINSEKHKLFNRTHELSKKLNELANENRQLKEN